MLRFIIGVFALMLTVHGVAPAFAQGEITLLGCTAERQPEPDPLTAALSFALHLGEGAASAALEMLAAPLKIVMGIGWSLEHPQQALEMAGQIVRHPELLLAPLTQWVADVQQAWGHDPDRLAFLLGEGAFNAATIACGAVSGVRKLADVADAAEAAEEAEVLAAAGDLKATAVLDRSVFQEAADAGAMVPVKKQLYSVRFTPVTAADGELVPTLENPAGELAEQGKWIAQRVDANGEVVIENGMKNQWPITRARIAKSYQVDPAALDANTAFTAPTRVDGPPVHMVQLRSDVTVQTSNGVLNGHAGDWLANYDYDAANGVPGHDFAIVSSTSFAQTYQIAQ